MRTPTDWNKYKSDSDSFFHRIFLESVTKAYAGLLKHAKFREPITILELGCGTGYTNKWLCRKYKVKKITLVDSNERMLNIAAKTLSKELCKKEFIKADFFRLKSEEKYDLVHSQGVIEHFEPKKRLELLKKHADLTKAEGYCVIYFPTPTFTYVLLRKIMEILGIWIFHDEVPLKKGTVTEEMESFGLKEVKGNYLSRFFLTEYGVLFKKK